MENLERNKIKNFTDLIAWKKGHEFVLIIYKITDKFPKSEIFGLTSQIRRAAVSVTSNIAEGFTRKSYKEKVQFYYLALSSLTEIQNQLLISKDIGYITISEYNGIDQLLSDIQKIISGLIRKTKSFIN